jgi:helix-turn-helix protein
MAKNLREGDEIILRFRVEKPWDDGEVTISHPLYSSRITISANEIPEEDVIRKRGKKPPEPEQRIHYTVVMGQQVVMSTYDRDQAHQFAADLDGASIHETPVKPRKKR